MQYTWIHLTPRYTTRLQYTWIQLDTALHNSFAVYLDTLDTMVCSIRYTTRLKFTWIHLTPRYTTRLQYTWIYLTLCYTTRLKFTWIQLDTVLHDTTHFDSFGHNFQLYSTQKMESHWKKREKEKKNTKKAVNSLVDLNNVYIQRKSCTVGIHRKYIGKRCEMFYNDT